MSEDKPEISQGGIVPNYSPSKDEPLRVHLGGGCYIWTTVHRYRKEVNDDESNK